MNIRLMKSDDRDEVIFMMQVFYASDAVSTNGSPEIFENDFKNCINESPYLEGYVFDFDGEILGYGMLAKSFSTEFGKPCIWIEDLYIKEKARGLGYARKFLDFVKESYQNSVIRLEVEDYNERALKVYKNSGFERLPYAEMIKF